MRGTTVTARRALLAVVVLAVLATAVSWYCCDPASTVGDHDGHGGTVAVLAAAHHADACDDDTAPLATAEAGPTPEARTAVAVTAGGVLGTLEVAGVTGVAPDAARGDPPSVFALGVLRT